MTLQPHESSSETLDAAVSVRLVDSLQPHESSSETSRIFRGSWCCLGFNLTRVRLKRFHNWGDSGPHQASTSREFV